MLNFILQIPILFLEALAFLVVIGLFYAVFRIVRRATQSKALNVQDIFSLKPGAVSHEVRWELPAGDSGEQVIGHVTSALQRLGARVLRQEGSQAVLYLGSRVKVQMSGIRFADPLTWPTRVLARVEVEDGAARLRVRMDEDYGFQKFGGSWFQDGYGKMFGSVVEALEQKLGTASQALSHQQ
jgi:hypothetical protein